jgi:predicted secreted Zn-dependent protease
MNGRRALPCTFEVPAHEREQPTAPRSSCAPRLKRATGRRHTTLLTGPTMKRFTGVTAFTVWLLASGLTCALRGADEIKYYDVAGNSATELRESLNRQRPVGPDGMPHDAVTLWYTRWQYRTTTSGSGCAVASFEVSLEIVTTLPRWTNEAAAGSSLVARWRGYYEALVRHEDGHKAIAKETAAAIRHAGTNMPSNSSCAELARAVDRVANDVLKQNREKERQYDKETQHGRTQGARFP